jgi:hypothetical protein
MLRRPEEYCLGEALDHYRPDARSNFYLLNPRRHGTDVDFHLWQDKSLWDVITI